MIIYDLNCSHGHRFEGWFASAEDFARQRDASLVGCPVCENTNVVHLPSAQVRVPKSAAGRPQDSTAGAESASGEMVAGLPPDALAKLREIVRNTENVGRRFPEEARKIHYEETPSRPIRGQASPDEADALREEGIDFASLPPFLTRDHH